jgi:hypothetical protein
MGPHFVRRRLFRRLPALLLAVSTIVLSCIPVLEARDSGPAMGRAPPSSFANWSSDSLIVPWNAPTIQPSMAACPDGGIFVVWVDGRAGAPAIYFKKLDPAGHVVVGDTMVSDDGIDINNSTPVALAGPDGSLHVLWPGHEVEYVCISLCYRSFNATGAPTSDTVENWLNTTLAAEGAWVYRNITAQSLPDGSISAAFEVAWNTLINTHPPEKYPTIGWMRLAPDGTKLAEAGLNMISRDNATPVKQKNPTIAVDNSSRTHAFWVDIAEQSTPMLRWSVLNVSGAGVQGFMTLSGEPAPSICAVNGPADNMSVVFIDRGSGPVKMASYPAAGTPVNASVRTIYYWDINASGEMVPRWSVRAVRYGAGNVIVVCEGEPTGDFGPNIAPYSVGLFEVGPDGSLILESPQFINEDFNVSPPPSTPPPHILPSLAASPQGELFLCWQLRYPTSAGRPLGLHLIHTLQEQPPPEIWFETASPLDNFTMPEDHTLRLTAEARARPLPGGIVYQWYVDGVLRAFGENMTQLEFSANFSSAGNHTVSVMASVNFTPEPLMASHYWNITVINVDRPPMITSAIPLESPVVYNNDNPPVIAVLAKDPDGDALTYSWELDGAPVPGADNLVFKARSIKPGTHNLSVIVSAGGLNDTRHWQLSVQAPLEPLPLTHPFSMSIIAELLVAVMVAVTVILVLARRNRGRT